MWPQVTKRESLETAVSGFYRLHVPAVKPHSIDGIQNKNSKKNE